MRPSPPPRSRPSQGPSAGAADRATAGPPRIPAASLSFWLLAASLAANTVFVFLATTKTSPADSPSSGSTPSAVAPAAAKTSPADAAKTAALAKIWSELKSGDPATLATRLGAAGLSPSTIRAILAARAASSSDADGEDPAAARDPAARARAKALADARPLTEAQRNQYGDITRDQLRQIQRINSDYAELTREIRANAPGTLLPEDREKLAYLDKEKLADLAGVLSPQEFEDYQLRNSGTANSLRYLRDQAVGFRASDDEFRAIYRATAAADSQYDALVAAGNMTAAEANRQKQAAIDAQLQATLSSDRYADYKRATDPAYQPVNRLVTRLDLPAATSDEVVALQKDLQQRATAIRSNSKAPVPVRNEQLAALSEEAAAKLTAALTPRGFDAYRQDGMGSWMRTLAPLPPPKPKS